MGAGSRRCHFLDFFLLDEDLPDEDLPEDDFPVDDLPDDLVDELLPEELLVEELLALRPLAFFSLAAAWRASAWVGILMRSPALILLPSAMPLARSRSLTLTPVLSAMLVSDSPRCTVTSVGCLGFDCFLLRLLLLELRSEVSPCPRPLLSLAVVEVEYRLLRSRQSRLLLRDACCRAA